MGSSKVFLFYAITLALAVLARLALPAIGDGILPLTMLTPAIAAAIMLAFIAPEGGFRAAIASLGLTRAGLKAWPLGIGGPVLIQALGALILVALGLTQLTTPAAAVGISAAADFAAGLFIGTAFALGEEAGWRGYMLPRMRGFGLVQAMLLVGFLHGVWHLPILLTTDLYHSGGNPWIIAPLFLLTLTLAGIFYGFLRLWTGSVWPVAIAHAAANMAWEFSAQMSQTKSAMVLEYIGGESGVIEIAGLLIVDLVLIRLMRDWTLDGPRPLPGTSVRVH